MRKLVLAAAPVAAVVQVTAQVAGRYRLAALETCVAQASKERLRPSQVRPWLTD